MSYHIKKRFIKGCMIVFLVAAGYALFESIAVETRTGFSIFSLSCSAILAIMLHQITLFAALPLCAVTAGFIGADCFRRSYSKRSIPKGVSTVCLIVGVFITLASLYFSYAGFTFKLLPPSRLTLYFTNHIPLLCGLWLISGILLGLGLINRHTSPD